MKETAIAALLLLVACGTAYADENDAAQWRIGGSLSYSDYGRNDIQLADANTGFKFHAQYRFNSWIGAEGAFYVSPDFKDDIDPSMAGGETETSYQGFTLHGIAYLPSPAETVDIFVKGGYYNFFDVNLKVDGVTADTSSDDGLAFGFGTSFEAAEHLGLRVEYDWYDLSNADLWTIGVGAEYRF